MVMKSLLNVATYNIIIVYLAIAYVYSLAWPELFLHMALRELW